VEQYQLQRKDLQALLTAVLSSLTPSIRITMWNADGTPYSLLQVFDSLKRKYGKITPADYTEHVASLDRAFQESDDFEAFIAHHIRVHRLTVLAGFPLGDAIEVEKLRHATINCAIFRSEIEAWQRSFPDDDIALQTFESLSKALSRAWRNRSINATAATTGWAASVQEALSPAAPAAPAVTLENLFALLLKTINPTPTPSHTIAPNSKQSNRRTYCWTHGETYHSSRECMKPAEGHDVTATWTERKGGKKSAKQKP
jgi:hypothetical protein